MNQQPEWYVGLLSGTSVDGIDAALVDCSNGLPTLKHSHNKAFPQDIRERICQIAADNLSPLEDVLALHAELGALFSDAVNELLEATALTSRDITAIGSHGQTIFHRPQARPNGQTFQLGDASIIAKRTGITTVADFRHADIALGGQGAPLAPILHKTLFAQASEPRAVLNLGGIANLTLLPASNNNQSTVLGYDTGPANTLMDYWIQSQSGAAFDKNGDWAASGTCNATLLDSFLADPYFTEKPPKSTGTDYFNPLWLDKHLQKATGGATNIPANNVMATLAELTATSIAESLLANMPNCHRLLVCGGGALNSHVLHLLSTKLPECPVESTGLWGHDPQWIEAVLFAWLAHLRLNELPGNMKEVTGASGDATLGAIHSA